MHNQPANQHAGHAHRNFRLKAVPGCLIIVAEEMVKSRPASTSSANSAQGSQLRADDASVPNSQVPDGCSKTSQNDVPHASSRDMPAHTVPLSKAHWVPSHHAG